MQRQPDEMRHEKSGRGIARGAIAAGQSIAGPGSSLLGQIRVRIRDRRTQ